MDNELLNEIHMVKNHSSNTKRIYKIAVEKYTSFFSMSLSELLEEAELEEDQGIKWKKRKVKRKILRGISLIVLVCNFSCFFIFLCF